jgi:hypothetical protein
MKSGRIRIKHAGERKRAPAVSRESIEFGVIGRPIQIDAFSVFYWITEKDNNFTDCSEVVREN